MILDGKTLAYAWPSAMLRGALMSVVIYRAFFLFPTYITTDVNLLLVIGIGPWDCEAHALEANAPAFASCSNK
jgi:hypothetical protein